MRTTKPPTPLHDCTTHGISSFGLFFSAVRQSFGLAEVYWFCALSAEAPYAPSAHSATPARIELNVFITFLSLPSGAARSAPVHRPSDSAALWRPRAWPPPPMRDSQRIAI